jgi:hypothetical protein
MKKVAIVLVLALVAFAATSSLAQTFTLRADVPIAFSSNGRHYAAGPYRLLGIHGSYAQLRNVKTGDSGFVKLMSRDEEVGLKHSAPNLKFVVNGRRAYLMSITDGDGTTWKVPASRGELEASRGSGSKTVIVALK